MKFNFLVEAEEKLKKFDQWKRKLLNGGIDYDDHKENLNIDSFQWDDHLNETSRTEHNNIINSNNNNDNKLIIEKPIELYCCCDCDNENSFQPFSITKTSMPSSIFRVRSSWSTSSFSSPSSSSSSHSLSFISSSPSLPLLGSSKTSKPSRASSLMPSFDRKKIEPQVFQLYGSLLLKTVLTTPTTIAIFIILVMSHWTIWSGFSVMAVGLKKHHSHHDSALSTLHYQSHSPLWNNNTNEKTTTLDDLLHEATLEEAIRKLANAWHSMHQSINQSTIETHLISPITDNNQQPNHPASARFRRSIKKTKKIDETEMMASDDTRPYDHLGKNQSSFLTNEEKKTNFKKPINLLSMNGSCTGCLKTKDTRMLRIENIKFNILSKLGLERPPNVSMKMLPMIPPISHLLSKYSLMMSDDSRVLSSSSSSEKIPSFIYSKINNNNEEDYFGPLTSNNNNKDDEFFVNAEKSIVFAQQPPADRVVGNEYRVQYFKFPANIYNSQVQRAYLWLYLKGSSLRNAIKQNDTGYWIVLYQVVRGSTSLFLKNKSKKISENTAKKGGWIQIKVDKLVSKWLQNPEDNLGLVIHSYDSAGQMLTVIHSDDVSLDSSFRPFIEIRVNRTPQSRTKRILSMNCDEKSPEIRCCRYPLTVDFEQFGWDWIIAPKRYDAYYCHGECPFVYGMNQYPHTHLVQQVRLSSSGPCCSPRRMSSISMLYMDNDYNIIYGILPNMVVDKCSCT